MSQVRRALAIVALTACSADRGELLGSRGFEIMGGVVAPSTELDHTGALVKVDPASGTRSVVCTATLISPETAVTARHCADAVISAAVGEAVAWVGGANIAEGQLVMIVAVEVPDAGDARGALGVGYDVGLVHFDEPLRARPALPRPFDLLVTPSGRGPDSPAASAGRVQAACIPMHAPAKPAWPGHGRARCDNWRTRADPTLPAASADAVALHTRPHPRPGLPASSSSSLGPSPAATPRSVIGCPSLRQ
jgi:hypothetical protein